eukprot:10555455-Karenia_brevis.AAC.1
MSVVHQGGVASVDSTHTSQLSDVDVQQEAHHPMQTALVGSARKPGVSDASTLMLQRITIPRSPEREAF